MNISCPYYIEASFEGAKKLACALTIYQQGTEKVPQCTLSLNELLQAHRFLKLDRPKYSHIWGGFRCPWQGSRLPPTSGVCEAMDRTTQEASLHAVSPSLEVIKLDFLNCDILGLIPDLSLRRRLLEEYLKAVDVVWPCAHGRSAV